MFVLVFYEIRKPKRLYCKTSLFSKSKFWQNILRLKKLDQDVESIFTSSCFFDAEEKMFPSLLLLFYLQRCFCHNKKDINLPKSAFTLVFPSPCWKARLAFSLHWSPFEEWSQELRRGLSFTDFCNFTWSDQWCWIRKSFRAHLMKVFLV